MKRKVKQGSALYLFLHERGVLENGDVVAISQAKQLYWAEYRRNWKKTKRQERQSYEVFFSFLEMRKIKKQAKLFGTSPTNYIKQSALIEKQIEMKAEVGHLNQMFKKYYKKIEDFINENKIQSLSAQKLLTGIVEIEIHFLKKFRPGDS